MRTENEVRILKKVLEDMMLKEDVNGRFVLEIKLDVVRYILNE